MGGDVYRVHAVGKASIEWHFGEARFVARYGKGMRYVYISTQDEVIGNIHQKPELLKP